MVRRGRKVFQGKNVPNHTTPQPVLYETALQTQPCTHTNDQHTYRGQMPTCWTHVAEWSSCRGVLVAPEGRVTVIYSSCPLQFFNLIPLYLPTKHTYTQLNDTRIQTVLFIHNHVHIHTSIWFQMLQDHYLIFSLLCTPVVETAVSGLNQRPDHIEYRQTWFMSKAHTSTSNIK